MSSDAAPLMFALIGLAATGMMLMLGTSSNSSKESYSGTNNTPSGKRYLELKNDEIVLDKKIDLNALGLDSSIPTVIFAKASWCGHCVRATPKIKDIFDTSNINIIEVDETNQKSQKNLGVSAFPTFLKVNERGDVVVFEKGFGPAVEKSIGALSS